MSDSSTRGAATQATRHTPTLLRGAIIAMTLVIASLGAGLLAGEVLLRVAFDPSRVLDGDALWEYEWRHRQAARGSAQRPQYSFDTFDAELGWRPAASFQSAEVRTNSQGIRADRDFSLEPEAGISRIVLIGDSFTWGEEVSNDETFAARLEHHLGDWDVINLGVHGYGTDQQLLRLRRDGFPFEPNVVLLAFYEENLYRNVVSFRDYAKPRFRVQNDQLILENTPVPTPEEVLAREQRLPRSFLWVVARRLLRKTAVAWGWGLDASEAWMVTQAILDAAKRETEDREAEFVLMYIPYSGFRRPGPVEPLLTDWARETGTAYVNLRERFLEMPATDQDRLYDGHWTPYGNERVAMLMAEFLRQRASAGGPDSSSEATR
jgi:hypothetical protein